MKFNKLYIHGFKSFVEKTTVDFNNGITAIVGPNGSGKSNIMDAVRWVFGEQNPKELRGTEMDDVVFNGTQKRKAAGFAEVGLTLSEIDEAVAAKYGTFSEITITRKFYKTGEREYYINNRKCRLKDIKDIFMDTGLGARSISIIEQGKVDKIINATPEELRFFLEETAGVTRFKDKKKNAEKRLSQTKDNLERINDIITEIISRKDTLSRQVKVLEESQSLQARKTELEKNILLYSYSQKSSDYSLLSEKLTSLKTDLEKSITLYVETLKEENEANNNYNEKQKENSQLQEKRLESAKLQSKIEGEILSLKERINSADSLKNQLENYIEKSEKDLSKSVAKKENATEILDDLTEVLGSIEEKIDNLKEIIEDIILKKDEINEEFNSVDKNYIEITSNITNNKNNLIRKEAEHEHIKLSQDRFNEEKNNIDKELSIVKEKLEELTKKLEETENQYSKSEKVAQYLRLERDEANEKLDSLKAKSSSILAEKEAVINSIKFFEKEINDSADSFNDDATELRVFKPCLLIDKLKNFPKISLAEVGDVILFEDKYKDDVMRVVSKMRSSLKFTFESMISEISDQISLLSLKEADKGIYYTQGIYRKVGQDDKGFKILRLKERLDEEQDKLQAIESNIILINEKIDVALNIFNEKNEKYSDVEKEMKGLSDELLTLNRSISVCNEDIERINKRLSIIHKEIALYHVTLSENEKAILSIKDEIELLNKKQAEIEEERSSIQDKLDYITSEINDKKDELKELKFNQNGYQDKINSIKEEISLINENCIEIEESIKDYKNQLYNLLNIDKISWEKDLANLEENLTKCVKDLLSYEESLSNSFKDMEFYHNKIIELKKEVDNHNKVIKETEEEIKQKEISIASVNSYIEAISTQYFEKFNIDISTHYEDYKDDGFQPKKAKDEISSIDKRLEELGPINLNAINDYNEAEERYNFLSGQRKDLEESISDILVFINETNDATSKMFATTFKSVQEKFKEVFHILFGKGEASLSLTEPENMLMTGVEIYIQPPGKKLQNMSLLSGGEKALAAMTLLFALFLHKPTPFCFLDEVDAPLDDANVERYTSMVKALSDKTQFILITHNHNTMSIADSLYGVTMQEEGISQVVGVELEQSDQAGR